MFFFYSLFYLCIGTVGLSLGYPNSVLSFSGHWRSSSKLVLIGIMLLGRHRGLPDSVDKALHIPEKQETVAPEFDADSVRIQKNVESQDIDFPRHLISKSIFSTTRFVIDPNPIIERYQSSPDVLYHLNSHERHVDSRNRRTTNIASMVSLVQFNNKHLESVHEIDAEESNSRAVNTTDD